MPRKTPIEVRNINGAFIHDPKRQPRGRVPKSPHPLGDPPAYFGKDEAIIWTELAENAPATVLTKADRHIVETTCLLIAKQRRREITAAEIAKLMTGLSACGLTPVDRLRLTIPESEKAANPFNEFAANL